MIGIIGVVSEIFNTNENRPFAHKSFISVPIYKAYLYAL